MEHHENRLADGHISTYLGPEVRARIDAIAYELGLSRAAWVRMTILAALRREDAEVAR